MLTNSLPFKASLLATAITLTACGGSSGGGGSSQPGLATAGGDAGTAVISVNSGNSLSGTARSGGDIDIYKTASASDIKILKRGRVDAGYDLPDTEVRLGSNPAVVSSDTTVETYSQMPAGNITAGTLYMTTSSNSLYLSDGGADFATQAQEVTGLQVNSGATLTLNNLTDAYGGIVSLASIGSSVISLYFGNDILNDGVITTAAPDTESSQRPGMRLYAAAYHGSGNIVTRGEERGQSGGDIQITALTIQNSGSLDAQGADFISADDPAGAGGEGGEIRLHGNVFVENTGQLDNSGGDSDKGNAGRTDRIYVNAMAVYNSGNIINNEGSGYTNTSTNTGSNQRIGFDATDVLINTGNLTTNGAEALAGGSGYGGEGGYIYMGLYGAEGGSGSKDRRFVNSGNLSANGGDSGAVNNRQAGQGGRIDIEISDGAENYSDPAGDTFVSEASVVISGSMTANGGNATHQYSQAASGEYSGQSGRGGEIDIRHIASPEHKLPMMLVGYDAIEANGGDGIAAGSGGDISIYSTGAEGAGNLVPSSPIEIQPDIAAQGGDSLVTDRATSRSAGGGGYVYLGIYTDKAYLQPGELTLELNNSINMSGGNVTAGSAGAAGDLFMYAPHGIKWTSALYVANGGSDLETDEATLAGVGGSVGRGGDSSILNMIATQGDISVDGQITMNGGTGNYQGGDAGTVSLKAQSLNRLSGTVSLSGGNAVVSDTDSQQSSGGDAGMLSLLSADMRADLRATVTTTAGAGDQSGEQGGAFVNADCVQGECGSDGGALSPR